MHAATGGPNVKWGHRFQMGGPGTTGPPAGDGPGRVTRLRAVCSAKHLRNPAKFTAKLQIIYQKYYCSAKILAKFVH